MEIRSHVPKGMNVLAAATAFAVASCGYENAHYSEDTQSVPTILTVPYNAPYIGDPVTVSSPEVTKVTAPPVTISAAEMITTSTSIIEEDTVIPRELPAVVPTSLAEEVQPVPPFEPDLPPAVDALPETKVFIDLCPADQPMPDSVLIEPCDVEVRNFGQLAVQENIPGTETTDSTVSINSSATASHPARRVVAGEPRYAEEFTPELIEEHFRNILVRLPNCSGYFVDRTVVAFAAHCVQDYETALPNLPAGGIPLHSVEGEYIGVVTKLAVNSINDVAVGSIGAETPEQALEIYNKYVLSAQEARQIMIEHPSARVVSAGFPRLGDYSQAYLESAAFVTKVRTVDHPGEPRYLEAMIGLTKQPVETACPPGWSGGPGMLIYPHYDGLMVMHHVGPLTLNTETTTEEKFSACGFGLQSSPAHNVFVSL